MDSKEQLDSFISESRHADRPETRAKSSIGLVSFVVEQSTALDARSLDSGSPDQKMWLDAWNCILHCLADEWPLVREAFQEQLVKALDQSESLQQAIQRSKFMDQIMSDVSKLQKSAQDRLDLAVGILSLAHVAFTAVDGVLSEVSDTFAWGGDRVKSISEMIVDGWINSQAADQKTRACGLLVKSFTEEQLVSVVGTLTTSKHAQAPQADKFIALCNTILGQLPLERDEDQSIMSQALSSPAVKDWALALWLCDQLWIPAVFATAESIQESTVTRAAADKFIRRAPALLECISHLLRIQSVDNSYTLHRLIIACASFTNSTDLWNKIDQSFTKATTTKAQEILTTICERTPWSVPSSALASSTGTHRSRIMIPGSFSDQIIQIIQKELRPSFTHVKAQKLVDRAQNTIESHQNTARQQQKSVALIEETIVEEEEEDTNSVLGSDLRIVASRSLIQPKEESSKQRQRILIAPVTDTPNDEEEAWTAMDEDSPAAFTAEDPLQPKRWDRAFLGAVAAIEWCAQQPIQDDSRIHEVFMMLVGPILAMTDSLQYRYRIRGLDLLTRFLLQYHHQDQSAGTKVSVLNSAGTRRKPAADSRIWIKIFERTGLDQVLERSLKPLLVPMQTAELSFAPALGAEGGENAPDSDNDEMEAICAAFRAYLTLILVNTDQDEKPTSSATSATGNVRAFVATSGPNSTDRLSVENLFLYAVLGSFMRAKQSKEYRTLILEWARVLICPIISFDIIKEQLQTLQAPLSVVQETSSAAHDNTLVQVLGQDHEMEQLFQGVYGLGSITIKYLPTLTLYICGVLDFPFVSSPREERIKSLDLAWRATEALHEIMKVSRPRIPRYRGKILATLVNCWANSRIFPSPTNPVKPSQELSKAQSRLDQSLINAMQLVIEICQVKITDVPPSGLEIDLKVLKGLDLSIFGPLFTPQ